MRAQGTSFFALAFTLSIVSACGGPPEPASTITEAPPAVPSGDGSKPAPSSSASAGNTASEAAPPTEAAPPSTEAGRSTPPASTGTIPISPFKIVGTLKGSAGKSIYTLQADGTILGMDGTPKGKIDGNTIQFDDEVLWTVGEDRSVTSPLFASAQLGFDEADTLVLSEKGVTVTLAIDDSGKVVMKRGTKIEVRPFRVEGMTPRGRRAAALLSMSVMEVRAKD